MSVTGATGSMYPVVKPIIDNLVEPMIEKKPDMAAYIKPMMANIMYESFFKSFDDSFEGCGYQPFKGACTQYEVEAIQEISAAIDAKKAAGIAG